MNFMNNVKQKNGANNMIIAFIASISLTLLSKWKGFEFSVITGMGLIIGVLFELVYYLK